MATKPEQLFEKVSTAYNFPELEEQILQFWADNQIFEKALAKQSPKGNWVFYEGPPTANARPHPGHVLTRVIKALLPRFKTMQGYHVRRQAGWDTHGLPVELSVEKELLANGEMTLSGPSAIREYGLEKFNQKCFDSVRRYEQEWVKLSNRIGFWLDYDQAYFTFTNKYIESVWWLLKQFFDKGMMYKGYRIQWYSTLVGTGLSSHEVAQNWKVVKDPSVWVRANVPTGTKIGKHTANINTYFLLWTTTPWTLLSNVALCVNPDFDYVVVEYHNEQLDRREYLVLAEGLLEANGLEAEKIVAKVKGSELAGLQYERLFDYDVPDIRRDGAEVEGWKVITDNYVTLEDGTGIVHLAPAFGEDDYRIGIRENLPLLNAIDAEGKTVGTVKLGPNMWFKEVNPEVIVDLKRRGLLFRSQKFEHNYPHCYRTDAPLIQYPLESWFIKTTAIKDKLIANNQKITWQPGHIKDGRFGKWLENVVDWSLSRDRFWGTPLPVWECGSCDCVECLGSYAELMEKCPEHFSGVSDVYDQSQFNPHRPFIDELSWACPDCGGEMKRVRYVIDPWFDAGSMPFSQLHYPFENKELIDGEHGQFPADFISEAVDQTRGWFYTLHVISTFIKDSPAYNSCLVLGHILDEKGVKMSKRLGNDVDPWSVINGHGADAFRWYFYASGSLSTGARFSDSGVVEGLQRFIIPLWNVYSFFTIYANIDGFDPRKQRVSWENLTELDKWILMKTQRAVDAVTKHLDKLEICEAAGAFLQLVDCLTNWYVRRSRRRFWQAEQNEEKWAAYHTLHTVLTTVAKALAPFTPFIAEELYQKLEAKFDDSAPKSVHLCKYPEAQLELVDEQLEYAMDQARRVVSLGHAARKFSGVRVRQPLNKITLIAQDNKLKEAINNHLDIILEELNVKAVEWATDEREFVSYEYKPDYRMLGPEFGKQAKVVAAWIKANADEITSQLEAHQSSLIAGKDEEPRNWVDLTLDGKTVQIDERAFEVQLKEKPQTVAQRDGNLLLVLDTQVSAELKQEGLAREVVNRLQGIRKTRDFDYADRIKVGFTAPEKLAAAVAAHLEYITSETLAVEFLAVDSLPDGVECAEIEGMEFCFSVELHAGEITG